MNIWQQCEGNKQIKLLRCTAWRIVESQYQTATRKLVDSREEHEILEEIIESSKPTLPESCKEYHYLLSTPLRYPPLQYGSRFGTRYQPSLWYGSLNISTALAEKAYYRFLLLSETDAEFEELPITYSAFQADIETKKGINLSCSPFNLYKQEISKKDSYTVSQSLGTKMRDEKVEAFLFSSARCLKEGINVGLFVIEGFKQKKPTEPFETWQGTVTTSKKTIEFVRTNGLDTITQIFSINMFLIEGRLPHSHTLR